MHGLFKETHSAAKDVLKFNNTIKTSLMRPNFVRFIDTIVTDWKIINISFD